MKKAQIHEGITLRKYFKGRVEKMEDIAGKLGMTRQNMYFRLADEQLDKNFCQLVEQVFNIHLNDLFYPNEEKTIQGAPLHITDERMLQLMDYCINNKVKGITKAKAWCEMIGFAPGNIFNIRQGMQQFKKDHILQACQVFDISADFFFGITHKMLPAAKGQSPIDKIKEALIELEAEKKPKRIKLEPKRKAV